MAKSERNVGRRERNKSDKRARIRDAAAALFEQRGFDGTTTGAIAARAGVAKGTLFLYASDKQDLLHLVFHDRLDRAVSTQLDSLPEHAPLAEQLLHLFRGLFRMYGESPRMAAEFVRSIPVARGRNARAVQELTLRFLQTIAQLIGAARERGEVRSDAPELLAAANIFWLYYGSLNTWLQGFADLETALDPGLRMSLELQVRGLAAR